MIDMPSLRIGEFEASVPIVQGGMGVGVSLAGLASAVANQGGIGVISSVGIGENEPDIRTNYSGAHQRALRREIRKARSMSDGIIGVNIMVALTDFSAHVSAAVEEEVDIIFMGAGLPLKLPPELTPERLQEMHTELVPIVSSGKAASLILRSWEKKHKYVPKAVVVEGPKAGGHLGFSEEQLVDPNYKLEKLVPAVVDAVKPFEEKYDMDIAVIAAGGVYTGEDIHRFFDLGAAGVQMATAFVPTEECDAHERFKQAYVECTEDDLMIVKSPVGFPGRAIRNPFLGQHADDLSPKGCPWKCLRTCDVVNAPYCIAKALLNAKEGRLEKGFAFAGANAYRTERISTVKEVIDKLKQEYSECVAAEV